jgi:hypothetical protein
MSKVFIPRKVVIKEVMDHYNDPDIQLLIENLTDNELAEEYQGIIGDTMTVIVVADFEYPDLFDRERQPTTVKESVLRCPITRYDSVHP